MNSWIFQSTPNTFDLLGYISEFRYIYWSVGHLKRSPIPGDEVFVWKAYGKARDFAGVVAHGVIVEGPTEKQKVRFPPNVGLRYWQHGAVEKSSVKVGVQLDDVRLNPNEGALARELVAKDGAFSQSKIIKANVGTVFSLKPQQAVRLRELWSKAKHGKHDGVEEIQQKLEEAGAFANSNEQEAQEKVIRSIVLRRGQPKFRQNLLRAYAGKCAITGTSVADILEAAHIAPYNGPSTNHVTNGLLLRSDIHALFDLGLLSIDPKDLRIYCSEQIRREPMYAELNGKPLRIPEKAKEQPSERALRTHFENRVL